MSHRPNVSSPEDIPGYYEDIQAHWTGTEPSQFVPYCTEPQIPPVGVLTPVSLPDSSFRPSPALSQHSQEYHDYSEYHGYGINDPIAVPQGLGISAPFPSEFPRTSAPVSDYLYAPVPTSHHGMIQTPGQSPQGPPNKRAKPSAGSSREQANTPVNILPHPEGLLRMEQDRQNPQPMTMPPRPRAPGRGRRDPQAEEEDAFVETLRDDNVAWKKVREEFQQRFHKDASEARLQMRLLRRQRERLVRWDNSDIKLLIEARDLWEKEKFHFLSNKIRELGASRSYSPDQCRTQLRLLATKEQYRDRTSASPSAFSDIPPPSPSLSRKRPRALSLEMGFDIEEPFF